MRSYVEDDSSKYVSADNGLIYTPMLEKYNENSKINIEAENSTTTTTPTKGGGGGKDIEDVKYVKLPFHYQQQQQQNNLVNSFKNELNYKLKKQRDEIESKLVDNEEMSKLNPNNNLSINVPNSNSNPYETSSTSSSISNNDLLNSNNNLLSSSTGGCIKKDKPPILKPKPRNIYSVHYSEVPKHLVQTNNSSSSPSTSITDISSSNICSPHHDSDKYPMISSRNDSLLRPKQRPPAMPPASSLSASSSTVTTTFNRFITKQMNISANEASDVNFVNNSTLRRQNIIRNSDC